MNTLWMDRCSTHTGIPALPFCHVTLSAKKPQFHRYPKTLVTLGDHIRKRRLDLKLLQKDVGTLLGVDEATIWHWENNRSSPQVRFIPRVINFLDYNPLASIPESIGDRLLKYRKRNGLSQKELAKRIGIDPATLSRFERGTAKTRTHIIERASTFLDVHSRKQGFWQ